MENPVLTVYIFGGYKINGVICLDVVVLNYNNSFKYIRFQSRRSGATMDILGFQSNNFKK
jgi:hypothetical protein